MEAKYFRDYKHNYMILQCGQEAAARSYQYKILTSDKIREILRCSVRHINGTTYYYYDISSRTTLSNLFQSKKMSYEQVRDLLWQLHGICDKLAGFFMEEAGLVLLPEHIYYDFSAKRYIGLYYPDYRASGEEAYEPLMNFLMEHIDPEDRQLVEKVYRISEMSGEAHFLLEDAIRILEERNETIQEEMTDKTSPFDAGVDVPPLEPLRTESFLEEISDVEKPSTVDKSAAVKQSIFYPVFAVLSVLGIAGAAAVYSMFELTWEEEVTLYGVIAVLGLCFLLSLWGVFRGSKRNRVRGKREQEDETNSGLEESFAYGEDRYREANRCPDEDIVAMENVISRETGFAQGKTMPGDGPACGMTRRAMTPQQEQETDYYGNTIFFDGNKIAENKLYAMDRRNKQHIELKQFPCTIGKMAGCVDYVLADNSVSRIHAKFERQGDRVLLTDMNSTNGTYKNGLRMEPQETVEIEPGDEIRFGNLHYCYR